jgi:YHS domain-containing protein
MLIWCCLQNSDAVTLAFSNCSSSSMICPRLRRVLTRFDAISSTTTFFDEQQKYLHRFQQPTCTSPEGYAARIAASATENKILCSREFIEALKYPGKLQLISQGNIDFKNILEPAEIFEVLPVVEKKTREIYIDPVCQIRLSASETSISLVYGEDEYFFCSEECRKIFQELIPT